jgi:hypothetical protein
MQPGVAVANGRQAPALRLTITSNQVLKLVAAGKGVVVVQNEDHQEVFFFDRPDGVFRPIRELAVAYVSERYVPVVDLGLTSAWSVRLGLLPGHRFNFGLRFTRAFDETVLDRQFASIVAHGIDFDQALSAGKVVTTHGNVDAGLAVSIDRVSIKERGFSTE